MPGVVRPYTLTDVLQTIYTTATGANAGVSNTTPDTVIALVSEADEVTSMSDSAVGLSAANRGWNQDVWGAIAPWS